MITLQSDNQKAKTIIGQNKQTPKNEGSVAELTEEINFLTQKNTDL
jgi:hypothetical protein